jgi:hypothetical protein
MLQRELEVLGELAELGLKMARTIVAQANGEATAEPVIQGDLPLAFSRVSRAARMAVLLQARLIQEIKDGGRKRAAEDEDEGPVQWEVEWVDEDPPWVAREAARDEAEAGESRETERMESERPERLERDDIYADLMTLSKEELVARIRRDLGVGADQCATSPASGRGGPLADPGASRGKSAWWRGRAKPTADPEEPSP